MGDLTRHHYGFRKCDGFPQWDKNVVFFCVLITWRQRVSVGELHKVLIVLCGWCSSPTKLVANVSLRLAPRLRGVGKRRICIVICRLAPSYFVWQCVKLSRVLWLWVSGTCVCNHVRCVIVKPKCRIDDVYICVRVHVWLFVRHLSIIFPMPRYATQGFFQSAKTCGRGKAKLCFEALEKHVTIHMTTTSKTQETRFRRSLWLSRE